MGAEICPRPGLFRVLRSGGARPVARGSGGRRGDQARAPPDRQIHVRGAARLSRERGARAVLRGFHRLGASARDKLAAIDRIAGWAVAIARSTASEPDRLATERVRIRTEVLPRWTQYGASSAILDQVPPVPGVLQHNDLGSWNVVVDACDASRPSFTALDWESARPVGMPLWDLWYFLQDALACLDGVSGLSENDLARREAQAVRLLRGELQNSKILFEWTRRGVVACGIPDRAVGTLATLCFLDHGLSQSNREDAARRHGSQARALDMLWPSLARRWLDDPALGPGWDRWR